MSKFATFLPARSRQYLLAAGAVGALLGGCALRFLILAAGMHADLVAETVMSLIG